MNTFDHDLCYFLSNLNITKCFSEFNFVQGLGGQITNTNTTTIQKKHTKTDRYDYQISILCDNVTL